MGEEISDSRVTKTLTTCVYSGVLPFTGLFALPSVRSVLPGNRQLTPPLGCLIDFIGTIPNLAIIAGCATTLLLVRIHRHSESHVRLRSALQKGSPQTLHEP
ncbi:hypothetical protein CPB85DRAFT_1240339 [Mucidula mucida]|nr:hypothetical protein CPB85DRAFT_1240339 [Mucidula mucida]